MIASSSVELELNVCWNEYDSACSEVVGVPRDHSINSRVATSPRQPLVLLASRMSIIALARKRAGLIGGKQGTPPFQRNAPSDGFGSIQALPPAGPYRLNDD